ncbi:hypothetical protein IMZ48_11120 [Candidatus Bathyarchaeota archaeon]|nr:hypothetical protein [Candidatus Bathyarchaeota archaeon]
MCGTDKFLFRSAVNTYKANDNKNNMDATKNIPDSKDKSVAEEIEGDRLDIRRAGLIRIPVCSAEEAKTNLNRGLAYHDNWANYPCNK